MYIYIYIYISSDHDDNDDDLMFMKISTCIRHGYSSGSPSQEITVIIADLKFVTCSL